MTSGFGLGFLGYPEFPSRISGAPPAAAACRVRNLSNKLFGFKMIQLNKRRFSPPNEE